MISVELALTFAGYTRDEILDIALCDAAFRESVVLDAAEELGLGQAWLASVLTSTDRGEVMRACAAAGATFTVCKPSRRRAHAKPQGERVRTTARHKPSRNAVTGLPYPLHGRLA